MNIHYQPPMHLSEEMERILKSKAKGINLHAEHLDIAVQEHNLEKALAILRVLQSDIEITEQGLLQGVRYGDEEAFERGENPSRSEPNHSIQKAKETFEA